MSIKVLIIDDSLVARSALKKIIDDSPDLEVIASVADASKALDMIVSLQPHVITLDVQMPQMDGITFLEQLMCRCPIPVVMVSSLAQKNSDSTLRALELGAVDFMGKPSALRPEEMKAYAEELTRKIRVASTARVRQINLPLRQKPPATIPTQPQPPQPFSNKLVVVGSSTGGTEALLEFLQPMPSNCPPILVVQHMPENFTASFASRLDKLCEPKVIEVKGGEKIEAGTVYIAPGHSHLEIAQQGVAYITSLTTSPPVNRHRPSVEVLFHSATRIAPRRTIAVMLTGMGKDGATAMLKLREAGARTLGQDEASCVVYGMPREAYIIGAVEEQHPPAEIARKVLLWCKT